MCFIFFLQNTMLLICIDVVLTLYVNTYVMSQVRGPFCEHRFTGLTISKHVWYHWHEWTLIPAWISNVMKSIIKCGVELLVHSHTSTSQHTGVVVTMRVRDGKSNTEADRIDVLFVQARVHCDNKPRQIGLNRDYNKTFSISHRECWYYPFKLRIWCSKREPFRVLPALLRHVVLVNNGNCRLTMPVDKGRCACDALPHTFDTCVFKTVKIILPQ